MSSCAETCGKLHDVCDHQFQAAQADCLANAIVSYKQTVAQCEAEILRLWTVEYDTDGKPYCDGAIRDYNGDMTMCWPPMTEKDCPAPALLTCEQKSGHQHDTHLLGYLTLRVGDKITDAHDGVPAQTCKDVSPGVGCFELTMEEGGEEASFETAAR